MNIITFSGSRKNFSDLERRELQELIIDIEKLEVDSGAVYSLARDLKESLLGFSTMSSIQKIAEEDDLTKKFKTLISLSLELLKKAEDAIKRKNAITSYEKAGTLGKS